MADHDEDNFDSAESGASETYPQQCSALRKNGHVMLKSRPCKIVEMTTSKTGKHGHAKVHIVGIDIFTSKKYEDICPSTHNMNVPHVKRDDYELVNIDDGFLHLMSENGDVNESLKLPDNEFGKELQQKFDAGDTTYMVTVLKAMGEEIPIALKAAKGEGNQTGETRFFDTHGINWLTKALYCYKSCPKELVHFWGKMYGQQGAS